MLARALLLSLALSLGACSHAPPSDREAARIADGRAIAEAQCASCHAVGDHGVSPVDGAPPFRHVLERYSGASLAEDLIEGIRVKHAMPVFQMDPKGADSLIAYLRTVQSQPTPAEADARRAR
jgi:mono/diheme cytochrome c family protein